MNLNLPMTFDRMYWTLQSTVISAYSPPPFPAPNSMARSGTRVHAGAWHRGSDGKWRSWGMCHVKTLRVPPARLTSAPVTCGHCWGRAGRSVKPVPVYSVERLLARWQRVAEGASPWVVDSMRIAGKTGSARQELLDTYRDLRHLVRHTPVDRESSQLFDWYLEEHLARLGDIHLRDQFPTAA